MMTKEAAEEMINAVQGMIVDRGEKGSYNLYGELGGGVWVLAKGEEGQSIRSVLHAAGAEMHGDEEAWSADVKYEFKAGWTKEWIVARTYAFEGGRRPEGTDAIREWVNYERHEDTAGARQATQQEPGCATAAA